MAKVLLLGATGGCGSQVLVRLLDRGTPVVAVIRDEGRLPPAVKDHALLKPVVMPDGHLALSGSELADLLGDIDVVVSCLGHNLTFKGVYGAPRRLCTNTVQRICEAAAEKQPSTPLRLVVVSTEGVDRPDGDDPPRGLMERLVLLLLWLLLPPHADNMGVAECLHREMRSNRYVECVGVRPSDMRDGDAGAFTVHDTLQNGIFNAGTTTRANVGEFMADLVTEPSSWQRWRNTFPHILDVVGAKKAA